MKASTGAIVLSLILLIIAGCRQADTVDVGRFRNGVYENPYFGIEIRIPPNWHAQDDEARIDLMNQGRKTMAGEDQQLKSAMTAAALRTISMFMFTKYPVGRPAEFNPSIIGIAENLQAVQAAPLRGRDYFRHFKEQLRHGQLAVNIVDSNETRMIGSRQFDALDVMFKIGSVEIRQKHFCAVIRNYAVLFTLTFRNEDQLRELGEVLNSTEVI